MDVRRTKLIREQRETRVVGGGGEVKGVAGWLVPRNGTHAGKIYPLFEHNAIGGARSCEVFLDVPEISGRHAEVDWHNGAWVVTDLDSTNGTWVNGSRLGGGESHVGLSDNDVLKLGSIEVTFKCA